jgi:hypothetical protein
MRRLFELLAAARREVELRDCFVFGGLACVGYGLAQIYAPAAWIVGGATLFWLGVRRV